MSTSEYAQTKRKWRTTVLGDMIAEFLGTFVLIALGDGAIAMAVAALNQSGRGAHNFVASGDWMLIVWGYAFAVTFAVYIAGGISGAHLNPAITFALAIRRVLPWRKVLPFVVAQTVGAFMGAALVLLVYHSAIDSYETANGVTRGVLGGAQDSTATFSIFATFPAPYFGSNMIWPLIDQIVGTTFLVIFIFALLDTRNQPVNANLAPLLIGLVVAAIGLSFGANAGYAINPARDFGPRLLAYFAGWGDVALPGVHGYFWVPIIGPLIGGAIAVPIYDQLIHKVLVQRGVPEQVENAPVEVKAYDAKSQRGTAPESESESEDPRP